MTSLLQLVRSHSDEDGGPDAVLDAARDAFLDFGIRRSSMGLIARRAGISTATLHRRGQKADIVMALLMREVRLFLAEVDAHIDHAGSAEDQVADLGFFVFTAIREHELLQRLITLEPDDVLPLLTTRAAPVLALGADYLAEFIRRLQDDGRLNRFEVTPVAELMARMALSLALTPGTVIPLDEPAFRDFARRHVAGILR
ncbi:MAG TPA: TetR/AcrR family transcriptional regulator [Nocardioidaceae bacterium]|nr:TetR/AcrR family transcriptional regulator [Nocardioidaceae bacterium]